MEISHLDLGSKGAFVVDKSGARLAEMVYSKAGAARIIIEHTEVSEDLKGQGAGKQLVAAAVEYARKNKLKIIPLCPFASSVFARVKEFGDVLDK